MSETVRNGDITGFDDAEVVDNNETEREEQSNDNEQQNV